MLPLRLHPQPFGLTKLAPATGVPEHLGAPHFIARTSTELSIVAPLQGAAGGGLSFRLIEVAQTFGTTETGVLKQLIDPLAAAGVWVLALGTHDTDYLLVRGDQLDAAVLALGRVHRWV
jgi:hypothetical protein